MSEDTPNPVPAEDSTVEPEKAPVHHRTRKPKAEVQPGTAPSAYAVVSGGETDEVHASAIVFNNVKHRKSLSVHHLQRRLTELGYGDANADRDGLFAEHTRDAVAKYQDDNGIEVTGTPDVDTLKSIFAGDSNVSVLP